MEALEEEPAVDSVDNMDKTPSNPPIQPNLKVRRPARSYFFQTALIALTLYKTFDSGFPAQVIWGMWFLLALYWMVKVLLKPQYIELTGTKLTVYDNFFRSKTVDITDIERIEIEAGPFSRSKIILKDNKGRVKFDYYQVRNEEFDALMKELNVPIG